MVVFDARRSEAHRGLRRVQCNAIIDRCCPLSSAFSYTRPLSVVCAKCAVSKNSSLQFRAPLSAFAPRRQVRSPGRGPQQPRALKTATAETPNRAASANGFRAPLRPAHTARRPRVGLPGSETKGAAGPARRGQSETVGRRLLVRQTQWDANFELRSLARCVMARVRVVVTRSSLARTIAPIVVNGRQQLREASYYPPNLSPGPLIFVGFPHSPLIDMSTMASTE